MSDEPADRELREARHYLQLGLVHQAAERFKRVLAQDPDDAAAHALLSHCLTALKRPVAALHEAKLASALAPDSALSHGALGAALLARRDFRASEEHMQQAVALEPEEAHHYLALAQLYTVTDQRAKRAEVLERARALAPSDAAVLVALGQLALDQGDAATAREHAEAALRAAPQSVSAIVLMGFAYLRLGDVGEARDHAIWALRERADDHDALLLMAAIKARQSLWLGLWWRLNAWLVERGPAGAIAILTGVYVVYRVLREVLRDVGQPEVAGLLSYVWIAMCAYTWIGPSLFSKALQKELTQVRLREDF